MLTYGDVRRLRQLPNLLTRSPLLALSLSDYGNMLSAPLLPLFRIWVVLRDLFHLFLDVALLIIFWLEGLSILYFLPPSPLLPPPLPLHLLAPSS